MNYHKPVLLNTVIDYLITNPSGKYFDATLGFGGHSIDILKKLNNGAKLIATDKDQDAFNYCKKQFSDDKRVSIYKTTFTNIDLIAKMEFIDKFDGILADLGVSSFQLDNLSSGFTYRQDAPLDLRMNKSKGKPACEILNYEREKDLARIFREYGEEKKANIIAKKIIEFRKIKKIKTTGDLRGIISDIIPPNYLKKSLSRVFQALRIEVNNELEELEIFLTKAVDLLKKNGRIVVLSYHSLEDRIVKNVFKYETLSCVCPKDFPVCVCNKVKRLKIITKKPIVPSKEEIQKNRRARSAKLRVAERV